MAFRDTRERTLHILMFPWLAHGHISPYLELAKNLSRRNFYIYFCSTPINISSIKKQLCTSSFPLIELVELHLPSLPNLPPHYHTTKSLPPHLMSTLKEAFDMAAPSFSSLLNALKPDLLIYDYIQPWAPAAAAKENIPAVNFMPNSAASMSYLYDMCRLQSVDQYPFPSIYLYEHENEKIMNMVNIDSNSDRFLQCLDASCYIVLIKTFTEIESKYMGYLSLQLGKELVPVRPLVQEPSGNDRDDFDVTAWLNGKDQSSVVFVSTGSEYFMSKDEIEEVAYGLELSEVGFIWVIGIPRGEKLEVQNVLPEGFLERVGDRGLVIKDWVPQGKILAHPSVGGFVSHCGWSSVMEAIHYGIPVIAMPMQLDQPINSRLVVELGVGIEIKSENGKFGREEVARVISQMAVKKEGGEIRRRAKELSKVVTMKGEEEIDLVVEKFVHICKMSKMSSSR